MQTNVFKFLWKYLSKLKFLFLTVLLVISLGEIATRVALYYGSEIINTLTETGDRDAIFKQALFYSGLAAIFFFAKGLLLNMMIFLEARFLPVYMSKMAKDLFAYAHNHSTAFFAEEMAGNISGKIKTIIDNGYGIYYQVIWGGVSPLIALITSFAFIYSINVELSLIMLALNIVLIWILWKLSLRLAPYTEKRAKAMSEANGVLVDSITNASLVKNFSNYRYEKKHYFQSMKKAAYADRVETHQFGILFIGQGLLRSTLQAVFYALPIWYWYKGELNIAQYVLIQSLILTLSNIYNNISMNFLQFFKNYGGIKDGLRLLSQPCDVIDAKSAKEMKLVSAPIVFDQIMYHYKGSEPLFNEFNLSITAGQKFGLVGHSGSGKSTLVKLLSRYYDLQQGQIKIGDYDIAEVTQDSLRRQIALIPQDPSLFNRTIMENIRYGNLKATDEEVFAAAQKAYCHDFISALPNGYNSKVGERGVMLSGGERQRIAIARAVLKNSPILILDEATSALDSESEKFIQDSLKDLMKGKTVIAVAHRLSTLKEMDKLVVMDAGKIVEEGTHSSLLRKKGAYYNFYHMQAGGFLKDEE